MATTDHPPTPSQVPVRFEDAFARLQAIVETLESGEATLEESLALYTEGMTLVRFCGEKLASAQQRIEQLNAETASAPADGD